MADDELTLEPSGNGARPRKKAAPRAAQSPQDKLTSDSPVVRLEGAFQIAYERQWRFPVILNYGRDRKLLKELVEQLGQGDEAVGERVVAALIPEFFAAVRPVSQGGDPIVSQCRHSNIMDFKYHAQYLLLQRTRGRPAKGRTAENIDEISRAMGKGRRRDA